jgi:hypothetical protein
MSDRPQGGLALEPFRIVRLLRTCRGRAAQTGWRDKFRIGTVKAYLLIIATCAGTL